MSIEIFISYRRSDTLSDARYLHRVLAEYFDSGRIFFDQESIEPGDEFPQRIVDGVRSCQVLLALIGPNWLKVENESKRRIDDPNDFVRQEIALALEGRKKVIPVLCGDAPDPGHWVLPDVLAALRDCDILRLRGKNYEYEAQLRELVRLVAKVPGVSPPYIRGGRNRGPITDDPELLPNLCDRSRQDSSMRDTILEQQQSRDHRRPFVLVVHGRVEELHDDFVERVERFSLRKLLEATGFGSGIKFVKIFPALPVDEGQPSFNRRLRETLAVKLGMELFDDDQIILDQLQADKLAALVVVVSWHSSEVAHDAQAPLKRLFEYWSQFPDLSGRLIVGCIACIKYASGSSEVGWLKKVFSRRPEPTQALRLSVTESAASFGRDPRVMWRVLDELPEITFADLDRWVGEVEEIVGRLGITQDRLRAIIGEHSQPMAKVRPELEKLITQQ